MHRRSFRCDSTPGRARCSQHRWRILTDAPHEADRVPFCERRPMSEHGSRRNECPHVTPAAPNGDQWSGLASVVTIAFKDGLSLAARCSRRISIRLGWFGSAPWGPRPCQSTTEIPCGETGHCQCCRQAGEKASPDPGDSPVHQILQADSPRGSASVSIGDVHFGVRRRSSTRSSPSASISANTP